MRAVFFAVFAFALCVFAATAAVYHGLYPQAAALRTAHNAYLKKDYVQARVSYESAKNLNVKLPEIALQRLLEIYFRENNFAAADNLLQHWPYPKKREVLLSSIGMADYFGRYDEALKAYQQSQELIDENILHYTDLQIRTRNFLEAEKQLRKVISADPRNVNALYILAEILSWQKNYPESEKLLRRLLTIDSNNLKAKLLLARIASWSSKLDESAVLYQEILASEGKPA